MPDTTNCEISGAAYIGRQGVQLTRSRLSTKLVGARGHHHAGKVRTMKVKMSWLTLGRLLGLQPQLFTLMLW